MIERNKKSEVLDALRRQATVAMIGPRQVGKTTLALQIAEEIDALYLDLEDRDDRNRLSEPRMFFEQYDDRLIILDEIHRMPNLFETLRGVIDKGRRASRGKGRFLVLGSASIDLLKQAGETLTGRIAFVDLLPLSVIEVDNRRPERERLWLRGGYPDSYLATDDHTSLKIRKDIIRTYLERDIPAFGSRIPATTIERLWTMLAHRQGSILNASDLARSLETSVQSVTRYIDLLSDMLIVRRLSPYHVNIGKRLVKSPKVYVRDSGILHGLLGIENHVQLLGHPVVGASWEGFALENLLSVLPWRAIPFYFRTSSGAEVDLVIEHGDQTIWIVEIKRGASARVGKGFHSVRSDLRPARSLVVHAGVDRYPLAEGVEAIGLHELMLEMQAK